MDLQQIKDKAYKLLSGAFNIDEKYFMLEQYTDKGAVVSFLVNDNRYGQDIRTRVYKLVKFDNNEAVGYEIYEH